ncbi:oxygen-evolving enhancer protein 3 [Striga asiatica]|uniref:Oxygen-evolving enhancer protein 3 n=1 Tax=Striga asiatica TaxID=4170 RepID=A0A5A7R8U5_STRAF|nr:oxygen-evolving enhancer protein 3 [Striga asiatica]
MASMGCLQRGSSQPVLDGSLRSSRLSRTNAARICLSRLGLRVRAQQQPSSAETEPSRRAMLGLVASGIASVSFVQAVLAEAKPIKIGPPPPPSGGLRLIQFLQLQFSRLWKFVEAGTLNSDEARDFNLPLKDRFYLQPKTPAEAAARAKESAKEIFAVKAQIDKKAWPYVQNDLRLRAEYLRYDLNTVISAKPKEEKKALKDLSAKLFQTISNLDHAAKIKSSQEAEKYYAETVSALNDVLSKLGSQIRRLPNILHLARLHIIREYFASLHPKPYLPFPRKQRDKLVIIPFLKKREPNNPLLPTPNPPLVIRQLHHLQIGPHNICNRKLPGPVHIPIVPPPRIGPAQFPKTANRKLLCLQRFPRAGQAGGENLAPVKARFRVEVKRDDPVALGGPNEGEGEPVAALVRAGQLEGPFSGWVPEVVNVLGGVLQDEKAVEAGC